MITAPYKQDWIVSRVSADNAHCITIHGTNLNYPVGHCWRTFTWSFTQPRQAVMNWRYDCTNAEITPAALAVMERIGATTDAYILSDKGTYPNPRYVAEMAVSV